MLCAMTTVMLSLQPEYDASLRRLLDAALGTLAGLAATAVLARITWPRAPPGPRGICCAPAGPTSPPSRPDAGARRRPPTRCVRSAAIAVLAPQLDVPDEARTSPPRRCWASSASG